MLGVALVWFSAVMFVHLGLGDTVGRILHVKFVLFHCQKCLAFWSTLAYSLFIVKLPAERAVALSFALAYAALWFDLLLAKIATVYERIYKSLATETEEDTDD